MPILCGTTEEQFGVASQSMFVQPDDVIEKIIEGVKEIREKLIEFKKEKNSEIVIMQDGKIVKIKLE